MIPAEGAILHESESHPCEAYSRAASGVAVSTAPDHCKEPAFAQRALFGVRKWLCSEHIDLYESSGALSED